MVVLNAIKLTRLLKGSATRLDIAFAICYLARFTTCYSEEHYQAVKHVV